MNSAPASAWVSAELSTSWLAKPAGLRSLEWLYRLLKEPTRFKRMLALPKFVAAVKLGGRAK